MQRFQLPDLQDKLRQASNPYLEFLRVPDLSMGLYELAAGSQDTQQPHTEDESYYVLSGKAFIHMDGEDQPVSAGSIIYVPANVSHYFHTISEDLSVLVFFAPAEYERGFERRNHL